MKRNVEGFSWTENLGASAPMVVLLEAERDSI